MAEFHLGHIVRDKLKEQGRCVVWLSKKLNCSRSNLYLIFDKKYIDCELLMRLSVIMEYDFFGSLSEYYRKTVKKNSTDMPRNS